MKLSKPLLSYLNLSICMNESSLETHFFKYLNKIFVKYDLMEII